MVLFTLLPKRMELQRKYLRAIKHQSPVDRRISFKLVA